MPQCLSVIEGLSAPRRVQRFHCIICKHGPCNAVHVGEYEVLKRWLFINGRGPCDSLCRPSSLFPQCSEICLAKLIISGFCACAVWRSDVSRTSDGPNGSTYGTDVCMSTIILRVCDPGYVVVSICGNSYNLMPMNTSVHSDI